MESLINQLSQIRDVKKRRIFLEEKGLGKPEIEKILEEIHFILTKVLNKPSAIICEYTKKKY